MRIWDREVGPGNPCFIVAEGGSNHGGSLDAALALTDAAADAGASAMKWQLWLSADEMYDKVQFPAEWESTDKWRLPVEWLSELRIRAHDRHMAFGLSSFGFASLDEADKYVDFHKVASIEATWTAYVQAVMQKRKPFFVSIGMMDGREVRNLAYTDGPVGDSAVLACTVSYPATIDDAHVDDLMTLGGQFSAVGYSDHTTHPTIAPCAAVALGACVIEKHMRLPTMKFSERWDGTLRQDMTTPDAPHSIGADAFEKMVRAIRLTEKALGSSEKRIRPSEEPYLKYRRGPRGLRGA